MILVGNRRGSPADLARHLMNMAENDHVHLHEVRGFLADDLDGAFHEAFAVSRGTRCKKFLYSLSLSPPETENVPVEVFEAAIERIERKLGFTGQPRTVVFHEKKGRRHAHCVWSRIDAVTMRAIDPYQDKLTLESIARDLYRENGWTMPPGFKRKEDADPLNHSHAQAQQAKRTKRDPKELKRLFAECWRQSDSRAAFASALKEHGLILAKGDRRGHVTVDRYGEVYSVARWAVVTAKDVRARLGNGDDLPTIEEALRQFAVGHYGASESIEPDLARQAEIQCLEQERLSLVAEQRQTRKALEKAQERRSTAETKARSGQIPAGLKAAWLRLSGRYQVIIEEIEADAARCNARDRAEFQALIEQQLMQRRALQRDLDRLEQGYRSADRATDFASQLLPTDPAQQLIIPPDPERETTRAKIRRDPVHVLSVITDKNEEFSRNDVVRALAEHIDDPLKLGPAIDLVMRSSDLVEIDAGPVARYTTQDMLAVKSALSKTVADLSVQKGTAVSPRHISAAIAHENRHLKASYGAGLSDQQIATIQHCVGDDQIAAVVGLAGAGKSTMLSAVRDAYERQGIRVIGAALSGKAADGLESSSGIESRTLASLERSWKHGFGILSKNDVLVIDEAGMIGTRQLNRFVDAVRKAGAKLILVGDPEQLQPINAGTPFREIANQINAVPLTEIHRQQKDWQKKASLDFAEQRTAKALDAYAAHGNVIETLDTSEAIVRLVEDYMADLSLNGGDRSRLALAYRRKNVHAINQAIRAARKSAGELQYEILFQTNQGKRAFAEGDRILFTENDHTLGARNGMFGTVVAISDNRMMVQLDGDSATPKRNLVINTDCFQAFEHGYATTIHKCQGATVDNAYVLGSNLMDRHLTYVAMTRHRHNVHLYGDQFVVQEIRVSGSDAGLNQLKESPRARLQRFRRLTG